MLRHSKQSCMPFAEVHNPDRIFQEVLNWKKPIIPYRITHRVDSGFNPFSVTRICSKHNTYNALYAYARNDDN